MTRPTGSWRINGRRIHVEDMAPYRKALVLYIGVSPGASRTVAYFRNDEAAQLFIDAMDGKALGGDR